MIAIVNYGLGNIMAFANIYKKLNMEVKVVSSPSQLADADRIILPGVGAFDWAMTRLTDSGMRSKLEEMVIDKRIPVLGICVGMQMMAKRSDEGALDGLGWIDAEVKLFNRRALHNHIQLPHMGWNDITVQKPDGLFRNLDSDARFYFLHSYYFLPARTEHVLTVTEYNGPFASSVRCENVFGVQFHPEKSHQWGIQLLKNFAEV